MVKWRDVQLDEIITIKHGYAFKGEYFVDNETEDILVTPGNFKIGGGFKTDKYKYYNGPQYPSFILNKGDLLVMMTDLSKKGDTLGYAAKLPSIEGKRFHLNQRIGKINIKDKTICDVEFIHWVLRSRDYRNEILSTSTGSTVKHTSPKRILNYRFKLPPIEDQKTIAKILSDLDEKIELNRKMNQTLKTMAKAIYKKWFIDFDFPNKEGKPYKSVGGEFENEIPKNWNFGTYADAIELHYGKALKADQRIFGGFPVLGSNGIVDFHNEYLVEGPGIVVGRKGTAGAINWIDENFFPIDTTFYIKPRIENHKLYYYYFLSNSLRLNKMSSDSAVPGLNRNDAYSVEIVLPSGISIETYNEVVHPLFERMKDLRLENRKLNEIRDRLLPKLIAGKLKVNK